jgi:hypothetical protein
MPCETAGYTQGSGHPLPSRASFHEFDGVPDALRVADALAP